MRYPLTEAAEHLDVLGHAANELQRLALQGQYWGEATLELLQRAGVASGLRLLDVGCGAGDVALLAAGLVGDSGSVVGVDRSPEAIAAAAARASATSTPHVQFLHADLETVELQTPFDAIVGRFILMYFADPAATLRRLARLLRPGSIVAFLEFDI
jgi:ubiquinone/menaquinone biosynthesis C-methylase UbiE